MESTGPYPSPRKWPMFLSIIFAVMFVATAVIAAGEYQTMNHLQSENSSLNIQIAGLQQEVSSLQSISSSSNATISELNTKVNNIQSELNSATSINNLTTEQTVINDQTINQPASSYDYYNLSASYAGYLSVQVQTASSSNTYVTVIWSAYGINYIDSQTVGVQGTANFVVLPAYPIEVEIGNTNLISGDSETLSILYYY